MKTSEAAVMAKKLYQEGHTQAAIAKVLAKRGYLSQRSGKALTSAGVSLMISKQNSGHAFKDRTISKYAPKEPRPSVYTNPAFQKTTSEASMPTKFVSMPTVNVATNQAITRWDIAKLIEMSNDFQPATKRALLELIVDATVR